MSPSSGFGLSGNAESFTVSVPRRRWDITIEADLFEEIARIYGYDKLPATLPKDDGTAGRIDSDSKNCVAKFGLSLKGLD